MESTVDQVRSLYGDRVEQRIGEEPRIAVRLRPDSLPITLTFVKTRWPCDAA